MSDKELLISSVASDFRASGAVLDEVEVARYIQAIAKSGSFLAPAAVIVHNSSDRAFSSFVRAVRASAK